MNIFHCCVQKTASRWVKLVFSDPRILGQSGLTIVDYESELPGKVDARRLTDRTYDEPFPADTLVMPLYLSYGSFCSIPKPAPYRAFFVMRDPRDIVVSWYFSIKYSHSAIGNVGQLRNKLNDLSLQDGLKFSIDSLYGYGLFDSLASWIEAPHVDPNVMLVKYEDLTGIRQIETWQVLLEHCKIPVPLDQIQSVLERYSFKGLSGREQGEENTQSHLRKGVPADWLNHFDDEVEAYFTERVGNLPEHLGYGVRAIAREQLDRLQAELERAKAVQDQVEAEKEQLRIRIAAMETSKFWKARQAWFWLRQKAGLPGE